MSKIMRKYFIRQQRILGSLNSHVEEMVSGYKTVVAYGRETKSKAQFAEINRQYKNTAIMANFFGGSDVSQYTPGSAIKGGFKISF
jgi:ATP-binding cassette subfamily B protein